MMSEAASNAGIPAPFQNMALNYVERMGSQTIGKYIPGFLYFWMQLKHHFNVDNVYVRKKLKLLLFPRQKDWTRKVMGGPRPQTIGGGPPQLHDDSTAGKQPLPPSQDVNAPDLYIPLMSFVTFVLMVGLLKGTAGKFTPEALSDVMTSSLICEFLEITIVRLGFSALQSPISTMDVICYSFYKYVGLCLVTLTFLLVGHKTYYVVLLYSSCALALFYFQSLKKAMFVSDSSQPLKQQRKYFLFTVGAIQPFLMYWLSNYSGREVAEVEVASMLSAEDYPPESDMQF